MAILRRQDEHDRDVVLAWHAVAIYTDAMSHNRLSDVRKWLSRRDQVQGQSVSQQRAMLSILSAQYGYPVRWGEES